MKRRTIIEIIAFAFFFLFVYTSLSKLYQYDIYVFDLLRTPFLAPLARPISIFIPGTELIVAVLLIHDNTRKYAFVGSLILMTLFTIYVCYVFFFTSERPCTCGGIIRGLSWRNHVIFNLIFLMLAIAGIILEKYKSTVANRNN